jgi:hypothetical protein
LQTYPLVSHLVSHQPSIHPYSLNTPALMNKQNEEETEEEMEEERKEIKRIKDIT